MPPKRSCAHYGLDCWSLVRFTKSPLENKQPAPHQETGFFTRCINVCTGSNKYIHGGTAFTSPGGMHIVRISEQTIWRNILRCKRHSKRSMIWCSATWSVATTTLHGRIFLITVTSLRPVTSITSTKRLTGMKRGRATQHLPEPRHLLHYSEVGP